MPVASGEASGRSNLLPFRRKFGQLPGPADPLFFDADASQPRPTSLPGLETATVGTLEAAGISRRGSTPALELPCCTSLRLRTADPVPDLSCGSPLNRPRSLRRMASYPPSLPASATVPGVEDPAGNVHDGQRVVVAGGPTAVKVPR
jgi:hypothetical protein